MDRFHQLSFWLGFLTGWLFFWGMSRILPAVREARQKAAQRAETIRETRRLGVEYFYRNDLIRHVQQLHLAAPLFSLDEIAIPPKILAPPPLTIPGGDAPPVDALSRILPYLPDYPEFASLFGAEQFTLPQALSKGANLLLLGAPGAGKTFALAHLATQVAQIAPDAGALGNFIPFYIHAADLTLPLPADANLIAHLTTHLWDAGYLSRRTTAQFSQLTRAAFDEQRVLLLLDGVDELPPAAVALVAGYLQRYLEKYPHIRVVAAASPEHYDGLAALGLAPVALAGWDRTGRAALIARWGELWRAHIRENIWEEESTGIEAPILNNWLDNDAAALTPLELTLKIWAAYAGDALGTTNAAAFDAYIRRKANFAADVQLALERVAMQMILAQDTTPHRYAATNWSTGNLAALSEEELQSLEAAEAGEAAAVEEAAGRVSRGVVRALIDNGIFVARPNSHISFVHPALAAYFAGRGLANLGGAATLVNHPPWWGKFGALHYFAAQADASGLFTSLESPDPAAFQLMFTGRWLRDARAKSNSRLNGMRKMATMLQGGTLADGVRARAMAALALSGDAGVGALCGKLLAAQDALVRRLAALGIGALRDQKFVNDLANLLGDADYGVRAAVCYALANIGTQPAVETVATALLQLDEDTQRAAAEALSLVPGDGHALLFEAAGVEDLLVRRAAIYGLEKVGTPEAAAAIRKLQLEDEQWVVRNAAQQVAAKLDHGAPSIPEPVPPLHEISWLIAFAGRSGVGITAGQSAREMLLRALRDGDDEEKQAAMDLCLRFSIAEAAPTMENYIRHHTQAETRQAAANTLWHLRGAG